MHRTVRVRQLGFPGPRLGSGVVTPNVPRAIHTVQLIAISDTRLQTLAGEWRLLLPRFRARVGRPKPRRVFQGRIIPPYDSQSRVNPVVQHDGHPSVLLLREIQASALGSYIQTSSISSFPRRPPIRNAWSSNTQQAARYIPFGRLCQSSSTGLHELSNVE